MKTPASSATEDARLAALHAYVDVEADPPPELQAVVRLATKVTGLPHAVVNVIDDSLQRQFASEGFDRSNGPREDSMCWYSLGIGGFVHSPDARRDVRWAAHPWVDGRYGEIRSYAAAPLMTPDRQALGTLCVFDFEPRELTAGQQADLADLADLVVSIFDRERRTREGRSREEELAGIRAAAETARALQAALLPQQMPRTRASRLTSRYLPGTDGAEIGGDFFDAIATDRALVVVMGDVQGHNTAAAALMGRVRTAVRAYVHGRQDPATVLERTNQLMQTFEVDLFATCALVSLDEDTGEVLVASAGHPAPLVFSPGPVRPLDVEPGPPLGVEGAAVYPQSRHRLTGRSRLLLYTDGVVEWPREAADGELSLERALAAHAGSSSATVADEVLAPVERAKSDDAALLVLDYSGPVGSLREARVVLPADTRAVGAAREYLRSTLQEWELTGSADEAELVVSELVTNALLHTGSPAALTLRHDLDEKLLCVGVEDSSTVHPQPRPAGDDATGGRGMHIVDLVAARWWVAPRGDGKTVWADLLVA